MLYDIRTDQQIIDGFQQYRSTIDGLMNEGSIVWRDETHWMPRYWRREVDRHGCIGLEG